MAARHRRFSSEEKVGILRRHPVEKVPVSDLCDERELRPGVFCRWQKELFGNGAWAFDRHGNALTRELERRVSTREATLARRNEAIAELMGDIIALRRSLQGI